MNNINNNFLIFRPFGPSILKVSIPAKLIEDLNNYVDEIIKNKKKSQALDHGENLAGNVKQEFIIEHEFANKIGWVKFLAESSIPWLQTMSKKKVTEFNIIQTWIVRQFKNEYNPLHVHSGHISGVGYLKVPSSFGNTFQKNKKSNMNGMLSLVHGSKMFLSDTTFNIEPKVGDFYFFPNYLMHIVYPFFDSDEERRSVSFNAKVDNEVYTHAYGEE